MTVKRIGIKEFRELGYLQELNRLFLHPLGLALEVVEEDDGTECLGGIWDYRTDPEGIIFNDDWDAEEVNRKASYVAQQLSKKIDSRRKVLGYVIQPLPSGG